MKQVVLLMAFYGASLLATWEYPFQPQGVSLYSKATLLSGSSWVGPGLAVGFDVPLGSGEIRDYLRAGAEVANYYQAQTDVLDVSGALRVSYPIRLAPGVGYLSVYTQFLAGPSAYFNSPVNFGYHFAALPGVLYRFNDHWGIFTECGYSFHALMSGTPIIRNIHAVSVSLGVSYAF